MILCAPNQWSNWYGISLNLKSLVKLLQRCVTFHLHLYYYIKHLRIEGSIFYHGKFLLYLFYPSIRRIIFIVG
jgi:hypothetical protein